MEDPVTGGVQVLLTSKEDPVSMRFLGAQYISKLVKIAGIAIAASRTKAKATYVTLICKNCRNSKQVPCRPGWCNCPSLLRSYPSGREKSHAHLIHGLWFQIRASMSINKP
ncbi:hypothetical protein CIPAW_09G219800 [Carya illinoinensis]|uniref:MCM OB domain-containing protein n=1 Tax=Carya illinoinensis TaxID=32201 RepID=A0A8T1PKZ0_CARIL|nr:hypothetical protein CIPAW_09G219800 [Carya illinoinensis]